MPRFQYRAVDAGDHVVEASIEADDRDTALTRLRGEGLLPLRLDLTGYASGKSRLTHLRRWLSHFNPNAERLLPAAITVFVRELSMLLDAGIGADRALLIIARSTEQSALAQLATDLRQRVRTGDSLADALDQDPGHFDAVFRATVRAGEGGSALTDTLARLANWREQRERMLAAFKSALVYPCFLITAALLSFLILLLFVVPQFEVLFQQTGAEVSLVTSALLAVSTFLRSYLAVIAVLALALWLFARRRLPSWDVLTARLPIFRGFARKVAIERTLSIMAVLLANRMPVPTALELAAKAAGYSGLSPSLRQAAARVREGARLSDSLRRTGYLPELVIEMISVGEEAGSLQEILERLGDRLRADVEQGLRRLVAVIEPALIVLTGILVASIILTLLSAIASVHALVF